MTKAQLIWQASPAKKLPTAWMAWISALRNTIALGARFAKWRAVITINSHIPTNACIEANAHALPVMQLYVSRQTYWPIVEPEVLMDGTHDIKRCYDVTPKNIAYTFRNNFIKQNINLKGLILKPNMILPGLSSTRQVSVDTAAEATVTCLLECVPAVVPGIAFCQGGSRPNWLQNT